MITLALAERGGKAVKGLQVKGLKVNGFAHLPQGRRRLGLRQCTGGVAVSRQGQKTFDF
jgi:hypothetical protein